MQLENGNKIDIKAPENSPENRYIQSIKINGLTYTKNYFSYDELQKGAKIFFEMTTVPNKERGTSENDFPYSFSSEN
jgi:putative alpha-1,2-mannosidase